MKKITAIIVDDEQNNVENLYTLLGRWCPDVHVAGTAGSGAEALAVLATIRPQLVFLDIQMPGQNGLDFLRALPSVDFEVVFVTAFDQYGIEAIKLSALDYLVKPIDITELQQAVNKARIRITDKQENEGLKNMLDHIRQVQGIPRIALPTFEETRYVRVSDIIRCESSNSYTSFYLEGGDCILVCKSIKDFSELLKPYRFFRAHQSHLVNAARVKSLLKSDGGQLLMDDGTKVPVSRQHRDEIKKALAGIC